MSSFSIGIIGDALGGNCIEDKIRAAAKLGIDGVQIYANEAPGSPLYYSADKRAELRDVVASCGLKISAVCGDLGVGFGDPTVNARLIDVSKRIIELTHELSCGIMTTHIGVIPSDSRHPRYNIMIEAVREIADFSASAGIVTAIETGPEPSATLRRFTDDIGSHGIGVNMDPANLAMVIGEDPAEAVRVLGQRIVHTHAKDGVKLRDVPPEIIYNVTHPVPKEYADAGRAFAETPLGHGAVNFPEYLRALGEIGYNGFLTVERETGEDPESNIREAVEYLRALTERE